MPGAYLNLGKDGFSLSFGVRGAMVTVGRKGIKSSVGIPGTGMRYETPYVKLNPSERQSTHSNPKAEYMPRKNLSNIERLQQMFSTNKEQS